MAAASADGYTVALTLDRAWLQAPGRAFPVTIDPTTWSGEDVRDCFLSEQAPSTSACGDGELWAGHATAGTGLDDRRALVRFKLFDAIPPEANVQQAYVELHPLYQDGTPAPLDAYQVTAGWDDTATWNDRVTGTAWATAGGDTAADPEDTSAAPAVGTTTKWLVTDLARAWTDGSADNHGVLIRDSGSASANATVFASSDNADGWKWPTLEILYYGRFGQPGDHTLDTQRISDRSTLSVNVAGGNLFLSATDLSLPGRAGLDLTFQRTYNHQGAAHGVPPVGGHLIAGSVGTRPEDV